MNTFDFSIELSDNRERYFLFNNIVDNSNELLLYNDLSDIKIINDTDLYKKFEINNFKDGFTSFYFDLYEKKSFWIILYQEKKISLFYRILLP